MLFGLEIENFLSIRERQGIDLRVAANVRLPSPHLRPIWAGSASKAPLVVALFGANGAGKSNVLRALSFLASFAKDSFAWGPARQFPFYKFADDASQVAPTRFALHFGGPQHLELFASEGKQRLDLLDSGCRYVYELEISSIQPPRVARESLSYYPTGARRRIFERVDSNVRAGGVFELSSHYRVLDKVLRQDASVISTLAQLNHPLSVAFRNAASLFVSNIAIARFEPTDEATVTWYKADPSRLERLNRDISRLDIGIESASLIDAPGSNTLLAFNHVGLNSPIWMGLESHGTRQFIRIFPLIQFALDSGGVAIIDEFDSSMHPLLLPELARWFYDPIRNPRNAQLWMSCQSASLLEDLDKEQIFFCEKDSRGRTSIFGLRDIKDVRRVDNFYRKYLGGTYGAVPRVG